MWGFKSRRERASLFGSDCVLKNVKRVEIGENWYRNVEMVVSHGVDGLMVEV